MKLCKGVLERKARAAEGANTPTSAPRLPLQALSPRPPSLSSPDPHLGDEKAARARQRQGSATFISCFASPSPLLPPPQPRFGGDSPLVTEPIASGRAALRHPHAFVSSSCEAPGSGPEQGLQRSPQQLEPSRAPPGCPGRTRAGWRHQRTPAEPRTRQPAARAPAARHQPCRHRGRGASTARPPGPERATRLAVRCGEQLAAAAVLEEPTPPGRRTQRLLPAPPGWSCHRSPGLARGKVRPPVAFR